MSNGTDPAGDAWLPPRPARQPSLANAYRADRAVVTPAASCHPGTAPRHPRAGTAASRPRYAPPAAARAAPSSPPSLRSPRRPTPPACASSDLHPCERRPLPPRPIPRQRDAAQAQPSRTRVLASSHSSGSLESRNELDPGQRWSPSAAVPGQGAGQDTERPDAGCSRSIAANCSAKHRSVDRYLNRRLATPPSAPGSGAGDGPPCQRAGSQQRDLLDAAPAIDISTPRRHTAPTPGGDGPSR